MDIYERRPKKPESDTVEECRYMIHYLETFRVIAERYAADSEASEMCLQYAERIRNDLNHWKLRLHIAQLATHCKRHLSLKDG